MIWLITIALLIIGTICFYIGEKSYIFDDLFNIFGSILGFITAVVFIIGLILLMFYPYKVDEKLAMYESENIKIEEKVKNTIKSYMKYEKETYDNLIEDNDLTTLLIAYPELNSNELVKSEISLYIENNNRIKELKEDQINRTVLRYWLYFGN